MPTLKSIIKHLEKNKIKFEIVPHKKVFTAYDLSQTLGEKLQKIAKTLLLKIEFPKLQNKKPGYYILMVPASYQADFRKIKKALKSTKVELASERIIKKLGILPGAIVPFASLHKIELLLDKSLLNLKELLVSAGTHTESIRMRVKDLHKLEKLQVGSFGSKAKLKKKSESKKGKKK